MRLSHSITRSHKFLLKHKLIVGFIFAYAVVAGVLVWLVIHDWRAETTSDTACESNDSLAEKNRYIRIQLENQNPEEPSFEGYIYIVLGNGFATSPLTIQLDTSQGRGYAENTDFLNFIYNENLKTLLMKDRVPFDLVQTSGSHKLFPFDSARFDFTLSFKPQIPFSSIIVENRVHGFVVDCRSLRVSYSPERNMQVEFGISRDPLTQLTAGLLCVASLVFLVLILRLEKIESLATSVASFFFSLWSIRAILASEIKTFPTLLDVWILIMCSLMLFGLIGKILWTRLTRRKPAA